MKGDAILPLSKVFGRVLALSQNDVMSRSSQAGCWMGFFGKVTVAKSHDRRVGVVRFQADTDGSSAAEVYFLHRGSTAMS